MNPKFQIRSGKYAGKTIEWLQENEPSYLLWMEENRPEMLKGSEIKKAAPKQQVTVREIEAKAMVPNLNFYNEGPADISLLYLNKMREIKENIKKPDIDLDLLF